MSRGSIDISLAGSEAILPGDPQDLFKNGQFNRVPLMIGNTNAESILFAEVILGKYFTASQNNSPTLIKQVLLKRRVFSIKKPYLRTAATLLPMLKGEFRPFHRGI